MSKKKTAFKLENSDHNIIEKNEVFGYEELANLKNSRNNTIKENLGMNTEKTKKNRYFKQLIVGIAIIVIANLILFYIFGINL